MRSFRFGMTALVVTLLSAVAAEAQTISGSVTDAQNTQSLAAVQVFISELNLGVLSEGNGSYAIQNVMAGTHTVTAQRIGYRTAEQTVTVAAGQTVNLDFELESAALALDAVVVTGTAGGSQVRAIGNLVERVGVPDLAADAPVQSVEDVLTGRVPGVMMLGTPNSAGDGAQIRIRGNASVGLPGDPIVYVDGIRIVGDRGYVQRYSAASRLNDINPADIESIEVIKGPAAATLYGTEAANGVIQIVTKRGQVGAPVFDITAETGALYMPDHMVTNGWIPDPAQCALSPCAGVEELVHTNLVDINKERCAGGFLRNTPPELSLPEGGVYECNPNLFIHGLTQRYNIAVRGGTDLLRYSASIGRTDQDGVVYWNWDQRNSVRASLQVNATDNLSFTLNGAYSEGERAPPQSFWGGNFAWGGRLNTAFNDHHDRGFQTPPEEWYRDSRQELFTTRRSTWSLELNHQGTDWLSHRLVFGIDQINERFDELDIRKGSGALVHHFGSDAREGQKDVRAYELPVSTLDFSGTATFRFRDDLLGSASSYGIQYYHTEDLQYRATGENFAVRALSTVGAAAIETAHEEFVENTTLGLYVQQQFDWDNRIFITGAIRADDNSAFGKDFDIATYPKISGTWVVHESDFWNIDWVNQFRVRGAWGAAGQQPDAFAATRLFSPETGPGSLPVLRPRSFGNPDLGPERGEEIEVGFDAEFFDGRVSTNFTYFNRATKDAIVGRTVPPSLWPSEAGDFAGGIQLVNVGLVKAWGTETLLNVRALDWEPLQWDVTFAITTLGNEIVDMGGIERIQVGRTMAHYPGFSIASVSDKRVISAEFVNGVNGQVQNVLCDGGTGINGLQRGGAPVDCETAPRLVWGRSEPSWLVNVTNTWTILDNWRVTAMVDAAGGHWKGSDYLGARSTSYPTSQLVYLQDNSIGQAYRQITRNGLSFHKNGWVKLRELALSYTLPDQVIDRVGASRASVTIGARNLWRIWIQQERAGDWCDWEQFGPDRCEIVTDPEMSRPGYDFGNESGGDWPPLSSYSLRLNVTF